MLIVALVLAVIGLVALVTAVITGNELVAWVCIAASSLGVILLVVDAIRERQRTGAALGAAGAAGSGAAGLTESPAEATEVVTEVVEVAEATGAIEVVTEVTEVVEATEVAEATGATEIVEASTTVEIPDAETLFVEEQIAVEDHPEEVVHEEPEYDTYSDDEAEYPPPAEESALHTVEETELDAPDGDEVVEER